MGMWHGGGGTDWMHAFMPKAFAGHWHHRMRKQERSPGTRPTGCDSPWILEEWVGGRSSGQWAKPEAKTNRTHFWLHWGSCVDLWLKELTDKIKYALCPAVAAGDRRVFGSGFEGAWQGRRLRKAAKRGGAGYQFRGDQHQQFLVRKMQRIYSLRCLHAKQTKG